VKLTRLDFVTRCSLPLVKLCISLVNQQTYEVKFAVLPQVRHAPVSEMRIFNASDVRHAPNDTKCCTTYYAVAAYAGIFEACQLQQANILRKVMTYSIHTKMTLIRERFHVIMEVRGVKPLF
jgi:hypothetical protein